MELVTGSIVGPWELVSELANTNPRKWVCRCTRCGREDRRLAGHLSAGTQPGCGKCKTAGGVTFNGPDAKRRVAERNGLTVSEREMWAFENCDDDLDAQKIVDEIIARETAIMRAQRELVYQEGLRKAAELEAEMECYDDD